MDRLLVQKILGKKDSVDLGDSIYNLRRIGYELRKAIILDLDIKSDIIITNKEELLDIENIINTIEDKLSDENYINGYTNSKKYLKKYVCDIRYNLKGVLCAIEKCDKKLLTNHANILIDLVLAY